MILSIYLKEMYTRYVSQSTRQAIKKALAEEEDPDEELKWISMGLLTDILIRLKAIEKELGNAKNSSKEVDS